MYKKYTPSPELSALLDHKMGKFRTNKIDILKQCVIVGALSMPSLVSKVKSLAASRNVVR